MEPYTIDIDSLSKAFADAWSHRNMAVESECRDNHRAIPICLGFDITGAVERFVLPDSLSELPFRIGTP